MGRRAMPLKEIIEKLKTKDTPEMRSILRTIWEGFNIGILGLNSFILIYLHEQSNEEIKYVICSAALAYALVFLVETILLRGNPQKLVIVRKTKKIFRLIYTAIYLTVIMLEIIVVSELPDPARIMAYYGAMFIWVAVWGTNCLWLGKLQTRLVRLYQENKTEITEFLKRFHGQ